ncbi:probable very-long-chain enoyl-CoA reductase art-1 [Centruroides sculpturatus]|uniref:probable very-long-chain enoyl-CoA reductase art-1 n=1 Tax=Centruroides sculpturatus TaxID=218467 RepID=UPI000C6E9318|nr:probable very-long-chain enoyl-CoA reductase art-1 [Centruroides sculpturatus]
MDDFQNRLSRCRILKYQKLEVLHVRTGKNIVTLSNISPSATIHEVKKEIYKLRRKYYPERQALKTKPSGKYLADENVLKTLNLQDGRLLYFKDLGPQVGWKTVRNYCFLSSVAAVCWIAHYVKRLLETLFVHRFSHSTMPIKNLLKNCSYYWLFSIFIGYFVNHPLYTPPKFGPLQIYLGLAGFVQSEIGNFSTHWVFKNLRAPGTKERKIPMATGNPFTYLFNFVSCPNYTYEVMAWFSFTIMVQCLPAGMFTLLGLYQMTVWALQKHHNYKKEFEDYPKNRKAIIPFVL